MSVFHGLSRGKIVQAPEPGVGVAVATGGVGVRVGVTVDTIAVGVEVGATIVGVLLGVAVRVELRVLVGFRGTAAAVEVIASGKSVARASTPMADTRDSVFMTSTPEQFRHHRCGGRRGP
jgi:hypothetical protein